MSDRADMNQVRTWIELANNDTRRMTFYVHSDQMDELAELLKISTRSATLDIDTERSAIRVVLAEVC